jgi:hypothetical protein
VDFSSIGEEIARTSKEEPGLLSLLLLLLGKGCQSKNISFVEARYAAKNRDSNNDVLVVDRT